MKIRSRLLLLLLALSLAPMLLIAGIHRVIVVRIGRETAHSTHETLAELARHDLLRQVRDHSTIFDLHRVLLETACRLQAQCIEAELADAPPQGPLPSYGQFGYAEELPERIEPRHAYRRQLADGSFEPFPVSFRHQGYFVPRGVSAGDVTADLLRLARMTRTYYVIRTARPMTAFRQYTALESGAHAAYPGGDRPPDDFDPRVRPWYTLARELGGPTWSAPYHDASTGKAVLTVSMAVRHPDGSFAGVTAIDVTLADVFAELDMPDAWAEHSTRMAVVFDSTAGHDAWRPMVLVHEGDEGEYIDPHTRRLRYLEADSPEDLRALANDCLAGNSGVLRMPYRGRDSFWAYGAGQSQAAVPIVIVPYDVVTAEAARQEEAVWQATVWGLQAAGALVLVVFAAAIALAGWRSRTITEPIMTIAEGGRKLASGDFDARVDIRSGDELQELATVFNGIGPQLRERDRMKQSLALAMEIQQHLLPSSAPQIDGFDIAGHSVYCDETGGDYFDFIDLVGLGPGRVGIAVGDVSGHGAAAALLMASVRGVLRSHADRHGDDLSSLLQTLNAHLVDDVGAAKFMTLFYGVLNADSRTLHWISAGHGPMLAVRADGSVTELQCTGIPLGVQNGADYRPGEPVRFEPGDVFVVATDGVWEARGTCGNMFGRERLAGAIVENRHQPAKDIRDAIERAERAFCGTHPQEDDITAVVIKAIG